MKRIKQTNLPDIGLHAISDTVISIGTIYDGDKGLTHINWIEREAIPDLIKELKVLYNDKKQTKRK